MKGRELSRSTEDYDRGDKFEHYKRIPSLRQYVTISHREREVEVWTREEAGVWTRVIARGQERATLVSIGAHLEVRELYDAAGESPS